MKSLKVKCLLCDEVLEFNQEDTSNLLEHIIKHHPEIDLQLDQKSKELAENLNQSFETTYTNFENSGMDQKQKHNVNEIKPELSDNAQGDSFSEKTVVDQDTGKVLYRRKYVIKTPLSFKRPGMKKLYKTSIEKWRPGKSKIVCPSCGSRKRPTIKSRTDKVSNSPIGAVCILACWPFCFLPCLFPPTSKEYLHCSVCNYFLGMYDRKTEMIHPNSDCFKNKKSD